MLERKTLYVSAFLKTKKFELLYFVKIKRLILFALSKISVTLLASNSFPSTDINSTICELFSGARVVDDGVVTAVVATVVACFVVATVLPVPRVVVTAKHPEKAKQQIDTTGNTLVLKCSLTDMTYLEQNLSQMKSPHNHKICVDKTGIQK